MKCYVAMFFLAIIPLYSFADETKANEENPPDIKTEAPKIKSEVEKLSYFPTSNKLYLSGDFSAGTQRMSATSTAGTVADAKNNSTKLGLSIVYGLANNLLVGLTEATESINTEYTYGPGSTLNGTSDTYKASGLTDPNIFLIYRLKDSSYSRVKIDVGAGITPKTQRAKFATKTSDGNRASGGTEFNLQVRAYKETNIFEFGVEIVRTFYAIQQSDNPSDQTKSIETDAHQKTDLAISMQSSISDDFLLGGTLYYSIVDKYSSLSLVNNVTTSTTEIGTSNSTGLSVFSKFRIEEDSVLRVGIASLLNSTASSTSGTTKVDMTSKPAAVFQISWMQEF